MAARSAVVASRIGGVPEIVKDGYNGYLFDPWNSKELSEKICKVLEAPDVAFELGSRAHETAAEKYSWSIVGEKIVNIYEELLS
jgi:glycosyltransferase involved in cell wall biosynthesis